MEELENKLIWWGNLDRSHKLMGGNRAFLKKEDGSRLLIEDVSLEDIKYMHKIILKFLWKI